MCNYTKLCLSYTLVIPAVEVCITIVCLQCSMREGPIAFCSPCDLSDHAPFPDTTGLNQLREAEQYLSQARWGVVRAPECEPGIKARLHRNLGQLEAAKGNYSEARKHFAEDVSYWCVCVCVCVCVHAMVYYVL